MNDDLAANLYLISLLERVDATMIECRGCVSSARRLDTASLQEWDALRKEVRATHEAMNRGRMGLHLCRVDEGEFGRFVGEGE